MAQTGQTVPAGGRTADAVRLPLRLANYVRLGLDRPTSDPSQQARSAAWVEIDETGTRLMDSVPAVDPDQTTVDIVVKDSGGLDIQFDIPNGPLPELRQMIDQEIRFRSPFADAAHMAFWSASETPDGAWRIDATILMRAVFDRAVALIEDRGRQPGLLRRAGQDLSYAARPPETNAQAHRPGRIALVRHGLAQLPSGLRNAGLGTLILVASAAAFWVASHQENRQIVDAATQARSEIRTQAAAAAERRALDGSRARSNARLALVGAFSAALPDGVWLDQLAIEGDDIALTGFGPSTTEVQRILSTLPYLTDVRLASPVTRDNTQSIERFRIAATISGPVTTRAPAPDDAS